MVSKDMEKIKKFKLEEKKPAICAIVILLILIGIVFFLDRELAAGLLFAFFLTIITFFVLFKIGIKTKELYVLFLIAFLIHLSVVLFIYYANFQPFGGGADFEGYNKTAIELAHRFSHLNFSLSGLYTEHFFPILIGIIYMFTLPTMIVGQLFTVWLAALSVLLAYLVVLEIGGSKKLAFLVGLIISIYPSYLYFGSILLKDTLVIPFVLAGLLVSVKIMKNFSWLKFIIFFAILTPLINLRFYVGYALMLSFILCWPLLFSLDLKKRFTHWLLIIFLLGFSPQIVGNGYYGFNNFEGLLNSEKITFYREVVYNSAPCVQPPTSQAPSTQLRAPGTQVMCSQNQKKQDVSGAGSTFVIETGFDKGPVKFIENYSKSFFYSLLGPFPWQLRYKRQAVALIETIPWYLFIIISFYGFINFVRKRGISEFFKFYKFSLPLLIFGITALGALSLFIDNYGIIARIRIPVFICFLSMMFLAFNNDIEKLFKKIIKVKNI